MFNLDKKIYEEYGVVRFEPSDKTHFLSRYLWRKLSLPFTFLSLKLGLSPNLVTFLSLIFVLISFQMIIVGDFQSLLIASISLCVYSVLDHSDGEIARINKKPSMWGDFLDDFVGLVKDGLVIFSLTINISSIDLINWYYGFLALMFLMLSSWIKPEIDSHFSKSKRGDKVGNLFVRVSKFNVKKIYYTVFSGLTRTILVIILLPFGELFHLQIMLLGFCFFDFIGNFYYAYLMSKNN